MHVSRWLFAALMIVSVIGCKPAAPPVVGPTPNSGAETITKTEIVQPDKPPTAVQPTATKLPTVEGPKPAAKPPEKDSLRDLASRLVEPADAGGWRISDSAALELERLGPDAPKKLLPLLADPLLEVRRGAAFHLLASFDPAVPEQVAAFQKLLNDEDATIRGLGLQAARQMSAADRDAVNGELLTMLDSQGEPEAKNRAAFARFAGSLGSKGEPFAQALARAAASDPDDRVRSAATFAYCQVVAPPESAVPVLQQVLKDKKAPVRLVAAGRLRSLGLKAEPAASDLGQALADENEDVRIAASEALVRMGPAANNALRTALESKDTNAKKLALACLSSLGPAAKEVLPAIEKAQNDPDKNISEAAKVLVGRLK